MSPNTATPIQTKSKPVEAERQQATDQPTNMDQQESKDQRNGDQPELVLKMNNSERQQLITNLTDLSAILQCNRPVAEDAKQRTRKKINDSILLLVDLSPFEPTQSPGDSTGKFGEMISAQLVVELSRAESSIMMNHLVAIRDAVLFEGLTTGESKRDLVTESKRIIHHLLDLPCGEQGGQTDEDKNENNDEPQSKKQRVKSENSGPNEEFDKLKANAKGQEEQITSLQIRMTEPQRTEQEFGRSDIDRAEAFFKFEIAGISKLLEIDGDERHSDRFWCRGLQWSLSLRHKKTDGWYLSLFLNCHYCDPLEWSIKTNFKFTLFNQLPGAQDFVREKLPKTFKDDFRFGLLQFISCLGLTYEENGYIKDDKIVLGVELKAEPVVRKG